MATIQDVRDFTAWHDGTLFHLRNVIIPAIRRGAIDDAQVCLARRTVARRPNVSLRAMAEANPNDLLGTHPLDIDGMTAHAVVGQLAERLKIELREAEHARELKVDLQTQRDELQELCRQLDEFDWDDLERRLPRESTRMIGRMKSENDVQKSELSSTSDTKPEAANKSIWPAGKGWEFRPGEAAFQGRPFAITGKPVVILRRLAVKPGEPVLKSVLRDIIDPDCNAEEGCVRDSLTEARAILRKAFKLQGSVNPIPNVARGVDAAWKLAEDVLCVATKNPR